MLRIEDPLRRYSDRAKEVRKSLQDALTALKAKLIERESLQAKRVALQVKWLFWRNSALQHPNNDGPTLT